MKNKALSFLAIVFMLIGLVGIYKNRSHGNYMDKENVHISNEMKQKQYDYYVSLENQKKGSEVLKDRFYKTKDTLPDGLSMKKILIGESAFEKPFILTKDIKKGDVLTYDTIKQDKGGAIAVLIKSDDVEGIDNNMIVNGGKVDIYLLKKNSESGGLRLTTAIKISQGVKLTKDDGLIHGIESSGSKAAYLWMNENQIQEYYELKDIGKILILPASNTDDETNKKNSKTYTELKNELQMNKITEIKGGGR